MENNVRPAAARRSDVLPHSLPPFGVNREQAAALIGVSTSLFDCAVRAGLMPAPRVLGGRNIWDVDEVREAWKAIPHKAIGTEPQSQPLDAEGPNINPWDDV